MKSGVVFIARNNNSIDYVKQAAFNATRIKKYLDLPVSLITDTDSQDNVYLDVFENIITIPDSTSHSRRTFKDGKILKKDDFKNTERSLVYDLTPYDQTLLLDTDYIISNDIFKSCFVQLHDFLIYSGGVEVTGTKNTEEFDYITETGPRFYWATAIFFRKTQKTNLLFELTKHIQQNWSHYVNLYQIPSSLIRNDFIFSIAIHILNGHQAGDFAKSMPGTMFYTIDRDELLSLTNDKFTFFANKEQRISNISGCNVHVMNKFSLNRIIENDY